MPMFPDGDMSLTRSMAQSYILSGVRAGVPGTQIIGSLIKNDLWYKSTDFSKDLSYWRNAYDAGQAMKYTTRSGVLGNRLYLETGWHQTARYETVFQIASHDPLTGESYDNFVTVAHLHLEDGVETPDTWQYRTRGELEELVGNMLESTSPASGGVVDNVMPIMGFYNPNVG